MTWVKRLASRWTHDGAAFAEREGDCGAHWPIEARGDAGAARQAAGACAHRCAPPSAHVNDVPVSSAPRQGLSVDKLLYFFLGLRKGEIRRRVDGLRKRHPDETPRELARRVVAAQRPLSMLGGALLELPLLLPAIGTPLKLLGVAGATSALVRMHMAMMLEIALIHGFDIDDRARLKEMAVVVAATGLASGTPGLARARAASAPVALAAAAVALTTASELIGRSAIAYYGRRAEALSPEAGWQQAAE